MIYMVYIWYICYDNIYDIYREMYCLYIYIINYVCNKVFSMINICNKYVV